MIRVQNVAKGLEGQVAELEVKKKHAAEELKIMKEEHDDTLERHGKEITELKGKEALIKTSTIEEFKSSDNFKEVVEKAASSYFGEGFDMCKKQIELLHSNLAIQRPLDRPRSSWGEQRRGKGQFGR